MKKLLVTLSMLLPLFAHAGKAERDLLANEVEPMVKVATAQFKKSCGCDLNFSLKTDTLATTDDLFKAKYFASSIKDNVGTYCSDAGSKKALCQIKTIEFSKANTVSLKFTQGKVIAITDGQAVPSWEMLTREVDK